MEAIEKAAVAPLEQWHKIQSNEPLYSGETVVAYYLQGKKDGIAEEYKLLLKNLNDNINTAAVYRDGIFTYLRGRGFHPVAAYLNVISLTAFEILITLPENEFISDEFLSVYSYTGKYEDEINTDLFTVTFSFCDTDQEFDEEQIIADGFVLQHDFPVDESAARRT